MSENTDIVLAGQQALAQGGLGLGSSLFKVKPAYLELVSKATQQEGATPGKFRVTATKEQFDEMKLVLLMEPIPRREYYRKGEFSKNAKLCFSLDGIQPHPRAKEAPAPFCATCPMGDLNWEKWRKDQRPENLPPCRAFYHLVVADRATQMPYYFDIKGTSVQPFQQGMQNVARLLASMQANIKAENRAIEKQNETLTDDAKVALKPLPNIFDITFPITSVLVKGTWVIQIGKPVAMSAEARAEFGALYLDIISQRTQYTAQVEQEDAVAQAEATTYEAPAASTSKEVAAVIGKVVEGDIVGKEPITI